MISDFKILYYRVDERFKDEFSMLVLPAMGPSLQRYYKEGSVLSTGD